MTLTRWKFDNGSCPLFVERRDASAAVRGVGCCVDKWGLRAFACRCASPGLSDGEPAKGGESRAGALSAPLSFCRALGWPWTDQPSLVDDDRRDPS